MTIINVDDGSEFKGAVTALFTAEHTRIRRAEPGHHRSQAFVESFNRRLAERIFKMHEAEEMLTGQVVRHWVAALPQIVQNMNNEKTRLIKMTPNNAIDTSAVKLRQPNKIFAKEKLLPYSANVRIRVLPEEQQGGRVRATDPRWSAAVYEVDKVVIEEGQPILYYLTGKQHGYTVSELQLVHVAAQPPAQVLAFAPMQLAQKKKVEKIDTGKVEQPEINLGTSTSGRILKQPVKLRKDYWL